MCSFALRTVTKFVIDAHPPPPSEEPSQVWTDSSNTLSGTLTSRQSECMGDKREHLGLCMETLFTLACLFLLGLRSEEGGGGLDIVIHMICLVRGY